MFKKDVHNIKTSAPLRASDRRKLKSAISQKFALSAEDSELLVPDGTQSAKFSTHLDEPGTLYFDSNGEPIWFILGREPDFDRLVPTVYTLWKKTFLPIITTPQLVIDKMTSGADLMIPGVVSITPSHAQQLPLPLDSLVCVIPYQGTSRVPVAVGMMAVPSSEISEDAKGKAVVTLHAYRDALWERGSKSDPPEQVEVIGEDIPTDSQHTEGDTPHMEDTGVPEPGPSEPPVGSPVPELTPQEVDALLRQSLLYYIHVTLASTPSLLPLPTSTLYSDGILPSRPFTHPALSQINIKLSSYKKLKPFLKAVEKDGILKLKEMGGDLVVVSVDTAHLDVVGVGKWRTVGEEDRKQKAREEREAEISGKSGLLGVRELYKPIGSVVALFEAVGAKPTELYTPQALRDDILMPYITTNNLVHPTERKHIVLDEVLRMAILTKKEPDVAHLARDKVLERLVAVCQAWYEVGRDGKTERRKGKLNPISVAIKIRQGRKAVTLITGFEPFLVNVDELGEDLRKLCAAQTSATAVTPKSDQMEVLVQGKQGKAVTEYLINKGIPKRWIVVDDSTEKKK